MKLCLVRSLAVHGTENHHLSGRIVRYFAGADRGGKDQDISEDCPAAAKPIIAVIALYYAVAHWNDYFTALLYVNDKTKVPLQTVLREIMILNQSALDPEKMQRTMSEGELIDSAKRVYTAYGMKYSMVFIASAPLLAEYHFIQKYFVKGVIIGAVKE